MVQTEKRESTESDARSGRMSRVWRYGPLLVWLAFIFVASTAQLSASNTSRIIRPLLVWLFPGISEERLVFAHFIIRKLAHLTEYAILGLLAGRAFNTSSHQSLRRRWFLFSLLLVAVYAFSDEFHQLFIPSRTGSIYDSFIDITGGLIALVLLSLWRKVKKREEAAN
ncbi:MAG TPA: VanZ family protein [Pyrinomonadaceae bacterium]|jgi:VanZ family protein